MEIRRVQLTGGSSFVVTLPKNWVQEMRIKKNDPVGLIVQIDGTLLVTKETSDEPLQRIKEIDTTHITDPSFLFRILIGAYIAGFTAIRIISKQRIPPFVSAIVRDFTQMTIGQEVVEETDTLIAIKDLLNPAEMPFDNTIKRMAVIVKNMHKDAIVALETHNHHLTTDIINRDMDADRLNWLIARQTNMIINNTSLSRKMEISAGMAMYYNLISRIIERIGDHAVRIAENTQPIIDVNLGKKIVSEIGKASALSMDIFDRSIISFFNTDPKEAHKNIESIGGLENICGDISNMALKQETIAAISISYIAESIRRSGEYAGDISENAINYIVEDMTPMRRRGSEKSD
jgi:phosphate uptake regulator